MEKTIIEKRQFPRVTATFPIRITPEFLGETVDLSETGLRFVLKRPLLLSKAQAKIELSPEECIETEFKVIWNKHLVQEEKFTYGVCFIRFKEKDLEILKKILSKSKNIDQRFIDLTYKFRDYLVFVKDQFDEFDKNNKLKSQRIKFVEKHKKDIFKKIGDYLKGLWDMMAQLEKSHYNLYTQFLRTTANYLFIHAGAINDHIFKKPLGYPGDFMVMNYIYDYNQNAYLGESSYEMLINHFTCNVPIANSNIKRKEFLKDKILEIVNQKTNARILSVGSGSARELVELLKEGKLKGNFIFHSLDFEEKAIDYLKEEIKGIGLEKSDYCKINYIKKDYIELAKNKNLNGLLKNYDFIYSAGVFDYLRDRIATRLIDILFSLLDRNGLLILCNSNNRDSFYRVAYEIMGDWVFYHREKDQLVSWLKNIKDRAESKFEGLSDTSNYLFFSIKAKT